MSKGDGGFWAGFNGAFGCATAVGVMLVGGLLLIALLPVFTEILRGNFVWW